jgi:hypothetical protein
LDADGKVVPIFSQGDYDVVVGSLEEDKLPMYVIINRNTGVVENTQEVTIGYLNWLDSVAHAIEERDRAKQAANVDQVPLNFSFKN